MFKFFSNPYLNIFFRDVAAAEKALGKTNTVKNEIGVREKDFSECQSLADKIGDDETLAQIENLLKTKDQLNDHLAKQETQLTIGLFFFIILKIMEKSYLM